jgi:hypothetical protein
MGANTAQMNVIPTSLDNGDAPLPVVILFFCGAPTAWKTNAGKTVTLSSTEAKYYETSEISKEVIFAKYVLEEVGIQL